MTILAKRSASASRRIVIQPPTLIALPRWGEIWDAREILYRFVHRDILIRYRQTALGAIWVILQPLAAAGILAVVFGRVAQLSSGGVPYFVFSYFGMLAWNVFNGVITRQAPSVVGNQALVGKVFFPRVLVPLSAVGSVLLDFAVGTGFGVVLLFTYGINPGWVVLLIPAWLVLAVLFSSGIGFVLAALNVRFRDVGYIFPWLLQLLLFASPVAYSLDSVPANLRTVYDANPITWLLGCFRFSFLGQPLPPAWQVAAFAGVSVGLFAAGLVFFESWERDFADII